jgi:hypothetical protein
MNEQDEPHGRTLRRTLLVEGAYVGLTIALALGVVVIVLWLMVRGWGDVGLTAGIYAENRTDEALHFRIQGTSGWFNVPGVAERYGTAGGSSHLLAGPYLLDGNNCTTGPIVALGEDGREVARRDAPVCLGEDGHELWVIDGLPASPPG